MPVFTSSGVVPPTIGLNTSFDSPNEPWQAALGTQIEVPTLERNVRLKIPSGTQGSQRFRLREHGLPGISGKRGDLYVVAQINIPKKLTEREREIWSQLAKLHGS